MNQGIIPQTKKNKNLHTLTAEVNSRLAACSHYIYTAARVVYARIVHFNWEG